jgi:hypothetical protein
MRGTPASADETHSRDVAMIERIFFIIYYLFTKFLKAEPNMTY